MHQPAHGEHETAHEAPLRAHGGRLRGEDAAGGNPANHGARRSHVRPQEFPGSGLSLGLDQDSGGLRLPELTRVRLRAVQAGQLHDWGIRHPAIRAKGAATEFIRAVHWRAFGGRESDKRLQVTFSKSTMPLDELVPDLTGKVELQRAETLRGPPAVTTLLWPASAAQWILGSLTLSPCSPFFLPYRSHRPSTDAAPG